MDSYFYCSIYKEKILVYLFVMDKIKHYCKNNLSSLKPTLFSGKKASNKCELDCT